MNMDEVVTPRLDELGSPRAAGDIIFDLAALTDTDYNAENEGEIVTSDQLDINLVESSELDIHVDADDVLKKPDIDLSKLAQVEDEPFKEIEADDDKDHIKGDNLLNVNGVTNDDNDKIDISLEGAGEGVDNFNHLTQKDEPKHEPEKTQNHNSYFECQSADDFSDKGLSYYDTRSTATVGKVDIVKYSENGGSDYLNREGHRNEGVIKQSVEFSDVLMGKGNDMMHGDGFISIVTDSVDDQEDVTMDLEIEGECDINLDNITIQDKGEESDSGSEFDFELPTTSTTPKQQDAYKDKSERSVISTRVENQAEGIAPQTTPAPTESSTNKVTGNQSDLARRSGAISSSETKESRPTDLDDIKALQSSVQSTGYLPQAVGSGGEKVLEAARNEWDNVTTVQAGYVEGNTKGAEPTIIATLTPMSPYELTEILKQEDFSSVKSNIKTGVERKGLAAFVNFLFGPPKLKRQLVEERERIFCIAASQLSNDNSSHLRTLQTIYRSLTGSKFDNARYGSHWEEIGFQGTDPGTDLRSVGFLGLVNLLFLLKTPRTQTLASDIYRLSLHPTQNFPFCVMGINITRITIQVLREDLLNKECNRRGDVLGVVSEFYVGLYLLLFQVWKGQNKTITDSGFVIKDIEMKARKNTQEVFKNLDDYLTKKKTIITDKSHGKETEQLDFVNVCEDS